MRLFFLALLASLFLCQCASTPKQEPQDHEEAASTLPWNRPQRWEGQGAMGGMMGSQGN